LTTIVSGDVRVIRMYVWRYTNGAKEIRHGAQTKYSYVFNNIVPSYNVQCV